MFIKNVNFNEKNTSLMPKKRNTKKDKKIDYKLSELSFE